jgi:hypothetical protein
MPSTMPWRYGLAMIPTTWQRFAAFRAVGAGPGVTQCGAVLQLVLPPGRYRIDTD